MARHSLDHNWLLWGLFALLTASVLLLEFSETEVLSVRMTEPSMEVRLEPEHTPSVFLIDKITCMQSSGWRWREYASLSWCESYLACGQTIPECPGGNERWTNIRDNSRVCENAKTRGYRAYCHPKEAD